MTREEAKEILTHNWTRVDNPNYSESELDEAFFMAIEALSSKPQTDLISRADAMGAVQDHFNADGFKGYDDGQKMMDRIKALPSADITETETWQRCQDLIDTILNRQGERIKELEASAEAVQRWIPFKKRPLTDEEKQEYPDWTYIFDCPLPDDEQEILLSNGKYVWTDTFINDGECYLDGGDDIDDGMAWMPLPTPYKGGEDK